MKTIEKIVTNPLLLIVIMFKDFVEIFNNLISKNSMDKTNLLQNYDWWGFSIKLITAISLWLVLRAYFNLKSTFEDKMKVFTTISIIRSNRAFIEKFDMFKFLKFPAETDAEFFNRLPQYGLLDEFYKQEYDEAKRILTIEFPNKTSNEIEKLLSSFYQFKNDQ